MLGFHQLKASFEFFIDPARNVLQTLRSQSPAVVEASIHGHRVPILEVFDDHVEQGGSSKAQSLIVFIAKRRTVELTRRREFNQASPDESSYETRSPDT